MEVWHVDGTVVGSFVQCVVEEEGKGKKEYNDKYW
jgi:hypothetical protein